MPVDSQLKILVLHGPNLNLLGRREPHIYGTTTLAQVNERLGAVARELNVAIETFQSNHEGELVDHLQAAMDSIQGCVINPAALTHTSVALHDCIKAMPFPVVEVHLSNPQAREVWRQRSITGEAARAAVMGFGWRSYTAALRALVELLRD
ncbi:MAG TPA: type II 3-dehydroquinate dehydratase [Chloroflexota bacterium]|nr:type II 3-dehydroquinate dehydratase [Chloroflexota bacterium]